MERKSGGLKIWHTLIILPCFLLIQCFYGIIALLISQLFHHPFEKDLALGGFVNLLSIGLVVALSALILRIPWRRIFTVKRTSWLIYPLLLVTIIGLDILTSEFDNIFRYFFHIPGDPRFLNAIQYNPWGAALTVIIIAPLTEETLFRGLILQGFQRQYASPKIAIILSALLFGAIHLNWQQAPGAAILGLLLGWVIVKTGSILPCLFIHGVSNSFVLMAAVVNFNIPGFSSSPTLQSGVVFQPLWFDLLGIILFTLGFWSLTWILKSPRVEANVPDLSLGAEN
ncbi:MAG TPA: type II CAAX endopeptidase family protein [Bacillota bacterium]|nr:type II CAAX endopeptidase family protein [Bacillota bacterium]